MMLWLVLHLLLEGALRDAQSPVWAEVYGRFMGGSAKNTGNLGRFGQSGQFRHMAQSRINTGDCTSG